MHGAAVRTADTVLEDLVSRLAEPTHRKFRHLEEERDALYAAHTAAFASWEQARQQLIVAQADATTAADADRRNINRVAQERHTGKPLPPSDGAAATAAVLARCQEREAGRRTARDDTEARLVVANQVLTACRELIRRTTDPAQLTPVVPAVSQCSLFACEP